MFALSAISSCAIESIHLIWFVIRLFFHQIILCLCWVLLCFCVNRIFRRNLGQKGVSLARDLLKRVHLLHRCGALLNFLARKAILRGGDGHFVRHIVFLEFAGVLEFRIVLDSRFLVGCFAVLVA